ncbi:BAH_G0028510.mRNA.1.CDS.1 [Saccharomyces cerevisiae]|nr:BAH_G0028510.mRNA.1.CDS.1 [Saccharomyces cerevisiae]CAI7100034.1 BAH_G0028510.mRNA.1.CDS.1 [Saccharomyces cerevisiae]
MPAKLQLDCTADPAVQGARHGNASAEKPPTFSSASTKTVSSFASHSSWHFFVPVQKYCSAPLSSIHASCSIL